MKRSRVALLVFGVVVLAGGGAALAIATTSHHGDAGAAGSGSASASGSGAPVPVVTAVALRQDVPMYSEGLGTVTPLRTITVKTQVDGQLTGVYFREGQEVYPGQQLAQVDPRPFLYQLHTAQGNLVRDSGLLKDAELNLERYVKLRPKNLVSQQQVDDQQALVDQYRGACIVDRAAIDTARLQLEYARISSPLHALTGIRQIDPGNIVHATDTTGIVTLTQLDPISVIFSLPEDDLQRALSELANGSVPVEAYSRSGSTKLAEGTLGLVDNEVNVATATLRLKAIFGNPDRRMWPSLFVKARVLLGTWRGVVTVPATVPQRGPEGMFAYVLGPEATVSMRPIRVDGTQGETAIVGQGLSPGEHVVSDGQTRLRPGARVAPTEKGDGADGGAESGASDAAGAGDAP